MDEVELLRALGDVWSDATKIIESMHALRRKIEELLEDAEGDDDLKEIYELVHNQIDAVMSSLRISQARIQSSVMAALPAAPFDAVEEEDSGEEQHGSDDSAVEAHQDAEAELADAKAAQPNQESTT